MKKEIFAMMITGVLFFVACTNGQTNKTNLSAETFAEKLKSTPNAVILDVRTADEFANGHIEHAKNINWNGPDFQQQVAAINKTTPVFVYCLSGGRSSSAAKQMRADGFKEVYELDGGMMKWRGANLPETTDNKEAVSTGMTKQQYDALITGDKLVLVDFYAEWCAPCKKMKPYLDEITKDMADKVVVVRIDIDANPTLSKELHIDEIPVLQLYKKGSLVWRNIGFVEKDIVVKELK